MELRQLFTFRMVATTLSFTQTAVALHYAQSSVTVQMQSLEAELGVRLFDRLGKRVALTQAGQRLLRYAEEVLALVEEARQEVSNTEDPAGTLTIGAPESLCAYRLPGVLRRFHQQYPRVQVLFRPGPVGDLHQRVRDGTVDVAFVLEEPVVAPHLSVQPLLEEPLLVVAAPEHPLTQRERVCPADLAGAPVLLTEAGCSYRALFERALAAAGVQPVITLEFSSVEAIKQCVMVGMGITILPEVAVQREVAQQVIAVLPWDGPPMRLTTQLLWHAEKWRSPALRAFHAMVTQYPWESAPQPLSAAGQADDPAHRVPL